MTEQHKRDQSGLLNDGVTTYRATAADLGTYAQAQQALRELKVPVLYHANNPHERLFVAAFDGTGNDATNDPEHATRVGQFRDELKLLNDSNPHIDYHYIAGPGTQGHLIPALIDKATGHTYNSRLENMYYQLMDQVYRWKKEDPQADIRLLVTGFSRGADQAAGFARLLDERGIQDPEGRIATRDAQGRIHIEYTKPPLVPPGQVAQALGLFDPVGTGEPSRHDRRLPSSVLSALQIVARDETRDAFPSTRIVPQGFSADGRTLGVTVAGAHSDIGGSYHLNGLGIRSANVMANYVNSLSDTPLMQLQPEPLDPRLNVIHRTEEHIRVMGINLYGTSNYREDGLRDERKPAPSCRTVYDCGPPEPVDAALNARFERHPVIVAPAPMQSVELDTPTHSPPTPGVIPSTNQTHDARRIEVQMPATQSHGTDTPDDRPAPAQPLTYSEPAHPHHALFRELKDRLPSDVSIEKVAELTLAARQGGVRPNRVESVHVLENGDAWVLGTLPGFDGMANLRTPAPPMAETMQKAEAFEQQQQAQVAQWQEQRQQQSHGRAM